MVVKRYTYPAVLFYDEGVFTLVMNDVGIVSNGESVEVAFESALDQFETYLGYALKFDEDIPQPTAYEKLADNYPVVLLISARTSQKER